MTEGSNQGLFVIVAIVIFGIFVSIVYLLFGDNLKPALSSIFKDSFENVNNVMGIGSSGDSSGNSSSVSYDDWVKDLENKGYVVAKDSDFSGDSDGGFYYIGKAKKVIIPKIIKGVTITKTKYMFKDTSVEAVAMKNPNVKDMSYMFYNNPATSLDLSNLFTENVTNMKSMFSWSKATSLDLSSFDTSNVTSMGYMFNHSEATSLDLSSFNTSKVTDMDGMFNFSKATSLDLSSFDTSNVTTMESMFDNSNAKSLDLSSFKTHNVRTMYRMFSGSQATSLNLSSFNTSKVKNMEYMFRESQSTELNLSSFDTSNVTVMNMYGMFQNSKATTGYAKTEADATKFNKSSNKPSTLNFVVK